MPESEKDNAFLERQVVTIPAEHWDAFMDWMERPAEENAALRELVGKRLT